MPAALLLALAAATPASGRRTRSLREAMNGAHERLRQADVRAAHAPGAGSAREMSASAAPRGGARRLGRASGRSGERTRRCGGGGPLKSGGGGGSGAAASRLIDGSCRNRRSTWDHTLGEGWTRDPSPPSTATRTSARRSSTIRRPQHESRDGRVAMKMLAAPLRASRKWLEEHPECAHGPSGATDAATAAAGRGGTGGGQGADDGARPTSGPRPLGVCHRLSVCLCLMPCVR